MAKVGVTAVFIKIALRCTNDQPEHQLLPTEDIESQSTTTTTPDEEERILENRAAEQGEREI